MKKIISLFLVFIFSFTMISTSTQKKPEALTLVAGYTISQILGAMALSATVVGAGYVISDSLVDPDNNSDFTDFLQTVFKESLNMQKYEIPPPPEPLNTTESLALISLLTKQGIEVGKELYQKVYDFVQGQLPNDNPFEDRIGSDTGYVGYTLNGYVTIHEVIHPDTKFYVDSGGYLIANKDVYYHLLIPGANWQRTTKPENLRLYKIDGLPILANVPIYSDNTFTTLHSISPGINDEEPVELPSFIKPPDFLPEPSQFQNNFKRVDLSPLNGLVSSDQELIDIINGNKVVSDYKYGKIHDAFNKIYETFIGDPNIDSDDIPVPPAVDPNTGLKYYGDPKLDEPVIEPDNMPDELSALNKALFWLKGIWQSIRDLPKNIGIEIGNIFQYLKNFIERFWQTFTEWWENNFLYHWTIFIDWLHTLPNLISDALKPLFDNLMIPVNALVSLLQNIWDWLQGFPDMLLGLIIPPQNSIAEVWEPVSDLFNQKISPVIQPFQNIGFYEEELQDISADIKIGQYQGNHKIIDYSYLKSVRDPIKSVIRSFLWILIIFFNLDQVHRLIRNQSIVKTYIRKVDEPGGNK